MIELNIPGDSNIKIHNIVFDYNGTIAEDGVLIEKVKYKFKELKNKDVNIYIITADTYGTVKEQCKDIPVEVKIFDKENVAECKKNIITSLGKENTVSIGNGRNDIEMFKNSVLSIVVIGKEGCYSKTLLYSDIVVTDILDAIDLLLKPSRIKATLRT